MHARACARAGWGGGGKGVEAGAGLGVAGGIQVRVGGWLQATRSDQSF